MPRIAALLMYPIESCRGIRVKAATVGAQGLEGDCRYRVIDEAGKPLGPLQLAAVYVQVQGEELWVTAAGVERLVLPAGLPLADAWFSKLLDRPVRCAARESAEGGPLLATTTGSLARLNQALPGAVGIERFSTSLVLEGTLPFEEDAWTSVRLGGARFVARRPEPPRLPFGVELLLEPGASAVQLRAGQTLEVVTAT